MSKDGVYPYPESATYNCFESTTHARIVETRIALRQEYLRKSRMCIHVLCLPSVYKMENNYQQQTDYRYIDSFVIHDIH
jgi:hypothetical protein